MDPILSVPSADQIGTLARSGAKWAMIQTSVRQVIGVSSTAILARLLLPADYGIVGMVTTFTALLMAISDMGMTWAMVQKRDLTRTQAHNIFWLNLTVGLVYATLTFTAAPFIARFYDIPEVANVARVTAFSLIIGNLASQPTAMLHRNLQFRKLTMVDITSHISGVVIAVVLALSGFGYWALVAQGLASAGIRLVMAFAVSDYRPGLPKRDRGTLSILSFGGFLSLSTLLNYVSGNVDNVLIGRVWGAEELGLYARAYFLMTLPMMLLSGSLAGVMQPSLSALAHDRQRMADAYRKAVHALAVAGFPIAAGIAVTAPEAVRLVYGPDWTAVTPILAWLSVVMLTSVIASSFGWLYIATGQGRALFNLRLVTTSVQLMLLLFAVQHGLLAVAIAVAIIQVALFLPLMCHSHLIVGLSIAPTLRVLREPFLCALMMAVVSLGAGMLVNTWWITAWILTLAVKVVTGIITFGVLAVIFIRPWPLPLLDRTRQRLTTQLHLRRGRARSRQVPGRSDGI